MDSLRLLALVAALCGAAACSSKDGTSGGGVDLSDAGGSSQNHPGGGADGSADDGGCPAAQTCGVQCCSTYQACVTDSSGNQSCAQTCVTGGECPMQSPCCDPAPRHGAGGVCMPSTGQTCLCKTSNDCGSAACAPALGDAGTPVGPYVCVPNSGSPYMGCHGLITCGAPYCCVTDSNGNQFCANPCTADSTCGAGHCDGFDFSASSCTGNTKACGL